LSLPLPKTSAQDPLGLNQHARPTRPLSLLHVYAYKGHPRVHDFTITLSLIPNQPRACRLGTTTPPILRLLLAPNDCTKWMGHPPGTSQTLCLAAPLSLYAGLDTALDANQHRTPGMRLVDVLPASRPTAPFPIPSPQTSPVTLDNLEQPRSSPCPLPPGRARRTPWPVRRRHVWQDTGLVLVKGLASPLYHTRITLLSLSSSISQNTHRAKLCFVPFSVRQQELVVVLLLISDALSPPSLYHMSSSPSLAHLTVTAFLPRSPLKGRRRPFFVCIHPGDELACSLSGGREPTCAWETAMQRHR
jgi:hypothetical protein